MIDARRLSFIDRLDSAFGDPDSIDSTDCLPLEAIFW
jgi:hypothetical protein